MEHTSSQPPAKSKSENIPGESLQLIRGKQAGKQLNVAFVGAGKACYNLLQTLDEARLSRLNMNILGVADTNPNAPGIIYAKKINLFATSDFKELYALEGLNFIIELTGSERVREEIFKTMPPEISIVDNRGARLLWDLVQLEIERTEAEKRREEYQERQKKYTQIVMDSLPYRVMVVNMDMTIETVNQTFLKEFGFDYKDVLGKYCYKIRYGLDKPCGETGNTCYLLDSYREKKDRDEHVSTIKEVQKENGKEGYEVITIGPIYNEKGEIIQLIEASRDVTHRIKLEREVRKSNTFFRNVIQNSVDGIVVVDLKGNVLIFNDGMEKLTGYYSQEIIKSGHLSNFYDIDVAKKNMKKMRSDEYGPVGKLNPTSMTITAKDGEEIPVTLSASIIKIAGKEIGSVGVFTDMREILKMRKDLEDAHFQLVESEKIASVGRMAAGIAHEINNPLSSVLIYSELLKETLKENPDNLSDLQVVIDQTLRCKQIVSELLEFSRHSIGKASSFSLEYLITRCLNLLINQSIFHDIQVKTDMDSDMPEMVGDMGQLEQVFTNLFINAAHAMEGKGRLEIMANYESSQSRFIIKVSDTGPGIPVEARKKIFDMFFTTKAVGKGTGLGLSISQNIIKLHGGNISFECPPEGGTTFIINMPMEATEITVEEPVFVGLDES